MPAYLSGELDPAVAEKIDMHLKACPGCRQYLEEMQAATGQQKAFANPVFHLAASRF